MLLAHALSQTSMARPQFTELVEEEIVAMMLVREEEGLVAKEEAAYEVVTQEPTSTIEKMEALVME